MAKRDSVRLLNVRYNDEPDDLLTATIGHSVDNSRLQICLESEDESQQLFDFDVNTLKFLLLEAERFQDYSNELPADTQEDVETPDDVPVGADSRIWGVLLRFKGLDDNSVAYLVCVHPNGTSWETDSTTANTPADKCELTYTEAQEVFSKFIRGNVNFPAEIIAYSQITQSFLKEVQLLKSNDWGVEIFKNHEVFNG